MYPKFQMSSFISLPVAPPSSTPPSLPVSIYPLYSDPLSTWCLPSPTSSYHIGLQHPQLQNQSPQSKRTEDRYLHIYQPLIKDSSQEGTLLGQSGACAHPSAMESDHQAHQGQEEQFLEGKVMGKQEWVLTVFSYY